jgi:hypothetical protein
LKVLNPTSDDLQDRVDRLRGELPVARVAKEMAGLQEGKNNCPFHDDKKSPSVHIYPGDGGWYCFGCGAGGKASGGPAEFVARLRGWGLAESVEYLEKKYGIGGGPKVESVLTMLKEAKARRSKMPRNTVDLSKEAAAYAAALTQDKAVELMELWKVDRLALRTWWIGWDERSGRYTLPVLNALGRVVDIRYRAEFKTDRKVISVPGCGVGGHLYGREQLLKHPDAHVVLVAGEKDVIIGTHHLSVDIDGNRRIFVSGTLGESPSAWRSRWNQLFNGRVVTICYDNDDTGFKGSRAVLRQVSFYSKESRLVRWTQEDIAGLPAYKQRGADLSDLILAGLVDSAEAILSNAHVVRRSSTEVVRRGARCLM